MSDMDGAEDYKKTTKYKVALWSVIVLSVLIVLAIFALVMGVMWKASGGGEKPAAPAAVSQPFSLPEGARIISSETQAGRLILRVRNGAAEEIYIVDTANGHLISRIQAAGGE